MSEETVLDFFKIDSCGNDFLVCDQKALAKYEQFSGKKRETLVGELCHRRFGVGADGLIIAGSGQPEMIYYNADGGEVEMCGNGLRATALYYKLRGKMPADGSIFIATKNSSYEVFDVTNNFLQVQSEKKHFFRVFMHENRDKNLVNLKDWQEKMGALSSFYIDTGVPHAVFVFSRKITDEDFAFAKEIRHDPRFVRGVNVNFVNIQDLAGHSIAVRTFERGVEGETFACGTGVAACHHALVTQYETNFHGQLKVRVPGGELFTEGHVNKQNEQSVWLTGPARVTFRGQAFW